MIAVAMSSYRRMTEDQYRAERAEIDATYGKTAGDRHGLYDQALASLFARSEWTQEELAKEEGKSRPWAVRHLLFGRFLANVPTGTKPKNLTEWRFRNYWERTDPSERNERIRFSAVEKLMAADTTVSKNCAPSLRPELQRLRMVPLARDNQMAYGGTPGMRRCARNE